MKADHPYKIGKKVVSDIFIQKDGFIESVDLDFSVTRVGEDDFEFEFKSRESNESERKPMPSMRKARKRT